MIDKRFAWTALVLASVVFSACSETESVSERELTIVEASRGDVTRVIGATGKIVPRTQVMVGSEVSGRILEVPVDFNSPVAAGDVLALIDPTTYESRVNQIRNSIRASEAEIKVTEAQIERAQVSLDNAQRQYDRRSGLFDQEAISEAQMEAAERDVGVARADLTLAQARLESATASVARQRADLVDALANLDRTIIRSPIDGVVIDRKVDPGQTVQASFSAPELFVIAADLSEIQVEADIVESDVAGLEAGDTARFTVDAYPNDPIDGVVEQLRLKSKETNNIITYSAVIAAPNADGRLMPGMTANLQITTDVKRDVPRLPVRAERFRPSPEDVAQFGATEGGPKRSLLDPTYDRLRAIGISEARVDEFSDRIEPATVRLRDVINDPTRSFMHTPMRIQLAELTQNMVDGFLTADERQAYAAALALERTIRPVDLWVTSGDGKMRRQTVRLGLSDGNFIEVAGGLEDGQRVVTGVREINPDASPQGRIGG